MRIDIAVLVGVLTLWLPPGHESGHPRATEPNLQLIAPAAADTIERVFQLRCAFCHLDEPGYAPTRAALGERPASAILAALTTGAMRPMAEGMAPEEVEALAHFLSVASAGVAANAAPGAPLVCSDPGAPFRLSDSDWNGWGRDLVGSRFQPSPGIRKEDVGRLRVKWAFALDGSIHSQPTVAGNRVFVSSVPGRLFALDAESGCMHWSYHTAPGAGGEWGGAGARSTVVVGKLPASDGSERYAAFLGDDMAHVHAIDVESGERIWRTAVDDHPIARVTGSPVFHEGRLYVPISSLEEASAANPEYECCTFRGSIVALDASTGEIVWRTYTIPDEPKPYRLNSVGAQQFGPAGAPVWSTPTIDVARGTLYVATGNSYTSEPQSTANAVLALDLGTGRMIWSRQIHEADDFVTGCPSGANCPDDPGPDFDFGSSPILRTLPTGGSVLVIGDKGGHVYGLDPDRDGEPLWEVKVGNGSSLGGVQWGSAADETLMYVAVSDFLGPMADRRPGVNAVRIATGEIAWHVPAPPAFCSWPEEFRCTRGHSAAISAIPGVVFSGSLDGQMRAFSSEDGGLLWAYDTARLHETVGGVHAHGGSMDGAGPTVANGYLYVTSGYARWGRRPGNVLLAFTVGGR